MTPKDDITQTCHSWWRCVYTNYFTFVMMCFFMFHLVKNYDLLTSGFPRVFPESLSEQGNMWGGWSWIHLHLYAWVHRWTCHDTLTWVYEWICIFRICSCFCASRALLDTLLTALWPLTVMTQSLSRRYCMWQVLHEVSVALLSQVPSVRLT